MANGAERLIVMIAGPNGAGKTTFYRSTFAEEGLEFINADEIAAELCPEDVASVAVQAGRIMLERIAARVGAGRSFVIETILSGRGYAGAIPVWRAAGYEVHLHFLALPNPEGSVKRVASRVREGGHHIPEDVIRRRFDKGLENFYGVGLECRNWNQLPTRENRACAAPRGARGIVGELRTGSRTVRRDHVASALQSASEVGERPSSLHAFAKS